MIKKILKSKSFKNSFWIISEKIIQVIISLIITMISARYLGPSNYGVLSYGMSFVTFFTAIMKLGIDSIIVKDLIDNKSKDGLIIGTSIFMRIISSFLSIICIVFLVFILKYNNNLVILVTFLQSLVLVFQAVNVLDYWFQSKLMSKYVSIAKIIAYFIACGYKVFLLANSFSVEWFAISSVIENLLLSIILLLFYKKSGGGKFSISFEEGKRILKSSYHFIISGLMIVIYTQIDKIMIGSFINEQYVGYYAAAMTIHSAYVFIPDAVITSLRPILFTLQKDDYQLYVKRLKQSFCFVFWGCSLVSLFIMILSKYAIILLYGRDYIEAVISLKVLVWAVPFAYLGSIRGIWTIGEGLQKYIKRYLFLGTIINIVLNIILINKIGIAGAAIATLITEIFTGFIAPILYSETRKITFIMFDAIRFKFN